jgi:hypothetical protein
MFGDIAVSGCGASIPAVQPGGQKPALTSTQTAIIKGAGYADLPSSSGNMVFWRRARFRNVPGYGLFDTSINYSIPVSAAAAMGEVRHL